MNAPENDADVQLLLDLLRLLPEPSDINPSEWWQEYGKAFGDRANYIGEKLIRLVPAVRANPTPGQVATLAMYCLKFFDLEDDKRDAWKLLDQRLGSVSWEGDYARGRRLADMIADTSLRLYARYQTEAGWHR
jgi:hypothetical protein